MPLQQPPTKPKRKRRRYPGTKATSRLVPMEPPDMDGLALPLDEAEIEKYREAENLLRRKRGGKVRKAMRKVYKLNETERLKVLELIGKYHTYRFIEKYVQLNFKKHFSYNTYLGIREDDRNKPFLDKFRQIYLSSMADVAIAQRKVRLDRLERQYQRIVKDDVSLDDRHVRSEARQIMAEARKEEEAATGGNTNIAFTSIQLMDTNELHKRKEELISKINRIGATTIDAA